ncbi:MAG: SHOCT domain-containing protein [Nitrospiraceae bacterium]|nr:MAG: SHOCT domain-containing protein [Nitrospiraceae bacterium]
MMHWDYGWGMGFGWVSMIVFWVLVVLGIVSVIKMIAGGAHKTEKPETAMDVLKKRYARGEIDREEFEQKKKDLI